MKLHLIVEILVLCALVAFATARVIDSHNYDTQEFTSRLLSNVTTKNDKVRQNEITVSGADYDDTVGSQEIVVGEDDLISNNVPTDSVSSSGAAAIAPALSASQESNDVALAEIDNTEAPVNIDDAHPLNRYCTCNEAECNCCREFKLPLVSVRGPGCASLRYLGKNRMSIAIKYGDITLTSRTISGRKAKPVCVNLPGGYSQFCGRVYGINRESDDFQACLGLELRAEEEVEAALRVSCFKFGPKGLKMTDAQPLPPVTDAIDDEDDEEGGGLLGLVTGAGDSDEEDYDDEEEEAAASGQDATTGDDDADLLGFADEDEEEDEDDDDDEEGDDDAEDDDDEDDEVAPAADYPSGFSLLDGFFGDSPNKKKKPVQTRNKVNTVAEDVKDNQVGAKVKIPNSPAILNSASVTQNEIDNNIPKDTAAALDPVDLAPAVEAAVEAATAVATADKPLAEEKPKPVESSMIADLQSNAGIPLVSTTAKPTKKKPTSFLDTIEQFISGGDDDDDDEEDDSTKDEAEDDDEEEEEAEVEEDDDDEEKDEKDDEEEDEEKEEEDDDEGEEEEKEEEDDDEEEDEAAAETTNEKETLTKDDKKTKKKNPFGLGFFARLMKFI